MRINRYISTSIGISRRKADHLIKNKMIIINDQVAELNSQVNSNDQVKYNNKVIQLPDLKTIIVNKPTGFVVSRNGQGSKTIYDLIPKKYHSLKPIGRLDKDSSGLLILTNDGLFANQLLHPSNLKLKQYIVELDRQLAKTDEIKLESGVELEDGLSYLKVKPTNRLRVVEVALFEGRNRQIRRTFEKLGYQVKSLNRTKFGKYTLNSLKLGEYKEINSND
jgi:23S rRNA pseudouridine2605 synthase